MATDLIGKQLAFHLQLIEAGRDGVGTAVEHMRPVTPAAEWAQPIVPRSDAEPVWLDRAGCLEFAVGSIGVVLGQEFAAIDDFPTRVRLPDEPLMLVDRIMLVEGQPRCWRVGGSSPST